MSGPTGVGLIAQVGADGPHAAIDGEAPRHLGTLRQGENGRARPQRRKAPRGLPAAGNGHNGLGVAAFGERDGRLADRLRMLVLVPARQDRRRRQRARLGLADDGVECLHGAPGIYTSGSLTRQHDRIHPISHGVRRVAHLGARRPRTGRHRLQHLRGDDHGNAVHPRGKRDLLLGARDALERHLETEIAPRHHHGVRGIENRLEIVESLRTFELRYKQHVRRAGLRQQPPGPNQVGGALHEADGHHVHTRRHAEREIGDVLLGDRRRRQRHARGADALVLSEAAALRRRPSESRRHR